MFALHVLRRFSVSLSGFRVIGLLLRYLGCPIPVSYKSKKGGGGGMFDIYELSSGLTVFTVHLRADIASIRALSLKAPYLSADFDAYNSKSGG